MSRRPRMKIPDDIRAMLPEGVNPNWYCGPLVPADDRDHEAAAMDALRRARENAPAEPIDDRDDAIWL